MEVETKKPEDTELDIKRAMRARVKDFKEQADSLTLEGVRRALEKDLGMKALSLDVHKRFIKQCLEECFYGGDDADLSTTTGSAPDPNPPHEIPGEKDEPQQPKDPISVGSDINEGAEEFLSVEEKLDHESIKDDGFKNDGQPSEDTIKKAIKKRAFYFRDNLEKITLAKVRRLLEEDLKLQKNTLDAYKSFISNVLDEVLQSPDSAETSNGTKKKPKKVLKNKETRIVNREPKVVSEDSGSSDMGNDESEADEDSDVVVKRLKKRPLKKSKPSTKPLKKQKTSSDEIITSVSRKKKRKEIDSEIGAESDNERSSENGGSSDERPKKKQEKPSTQTYGKHVEHLKSVIKACGMGVPPAVYKRAKQASDSKREAFLIKELEDILAKEGLSSNPSDKEIKSVKRKKERARELEGIDMSNIVSTSRRRGSNNFIPTSKQKIEIESDEDEEDEVEEDEVEEDEDDQEGTDEGDDVSEASSEGLVEDANADADEDSE